MIFEELRIDGVKNKQVTECTNIKIYVLKYELKKQQNKDKTVRKLSIKFIKCEKTLTILFRLKNTIFFKFI